MMIKEDFVNHIKKLQDTICAGIEGVDGKGIFKQENWKRAGGGGGDTRVITNGNIFEKGGVNTSVVNGKLNANISKQLGLGKEDFFACGLSLVLHPYNPHIPTIHANWRYFELYNEDGTIADAWFGGGTDLTPYYLYDEDAVAFHNVLKEASDHYDEALYPIFKKNCDDYFVNHHREGERRGIGGVFYDHCRAEENHDMDFWLAFSKANGNCFLDSYLPIVNKRKDIAVKPEEKYWQEIRRGRYVEFNLIHDRGTIFGLRTNGRTESILMSLPPTVRFDYNYIPTEGSREQVLLDVLKNPREWVNK